jgi:hypothetical protein
VQDEGVQQEADNDIDSQREPTGTDILDDLAFIDTHGTKLIAGHSWNKTQEAIHSGAGDSFLQLELDGADIH